MRPHPPPARLVAIGEGWGAEKAAPSQNPRVLLPEHRERACDVGLVNPTLSLLDAVNSAPAEREPNLAHSKPASRGEGMRGDALGSVHLLPIPHPLPHIQP